MLKCEKEKYSPLNCWIWQLKKTFSLNTSMWRQNLTSVATGGLPGCKSSLHLVLTVSSGNVSLCSFRLPIPLLLSYTYLLRVYHEPDIITGAWKSLENNVRIDPGAKMLSSRTRSGSIPLLFIRPLTPFLGGCPATAWVISTSPKLCEERAMLLSCGKSFQYNQICFTV